MLPHLFARRYLFSSESRSVVNLISGLSVAAVAMPVAAMIILLSVFNGFETLVKSMSTAFDADLTITPREGQTFPAGEIDTAALRRVGGVDNLSFTLEQSALLSREGRQATAIVRGIDDHYASIFDLEGIATMGGWQVRRGDYDQLVVGQTMAYQLGVRSFADADVGLYAVRRGEFSSLLPMENYTRREVPIKGVYTLDLSTEKSLVFTSLRLAQELFSAPDRISALALRLEPNSDAEKVRTAVSEVVGDRFYVKTQYELRASLYRILIYEKWGIFFVAMLVLIVASFSVVGALSMLIVEKRRDIATLSALGASIGLLRAIFRSEGLLICALGAMCGAMLGVGLSLIQQYFGLIEIPAETLITKIYPVEFRVEDLVAVALAFAGVAALLTHITVHSMIKPNNIR